MRRVAILLAAGALVLATPSLAQDDKARVAQLEAQLGAAQDRIKTLEERLSAVEGRLGPATEAPQTQTAAIPPPQGQIPSIDLTVPDTGPRPSPPVQTAAQDAPWQVAPPGPIDRPLAPLKDGSVAAFELIGGTGGGQATLAFTRSKDRGGTERNGIVPIYNDSFNLTLSTPLSKDDETPFATLDGLATGSKLEFGYTFFSGRVLTNSADSQNAILKRARERCRRAVPAYPKGCTRLDPEFKKAFMTPGESEEYERDYARGTLQKSFALSLRGALGYDEFNYYPVPGLAKQTDRKVSFSAGAGMTFFPVDRGSFSFDADYMRSFEAEKANTTCPVPAAGATTVTCVPGPLAGPTRTDKIVLAPEFRYLLPISDYGLIRDLGFGPRLEYDALSNDVALDLPIYFARDEDNGLMGGLRFGYLTKDDDFKFAIFVGKSFTLSK
jgi:hypothetical protein